MARLCLECQLFEQPFDTVEPGVALDCELERLAFEGGVTGIEKGDHRSRLAEMSPGGLDQVALPPRLRGRGQRGSAALAKRHALRAARIDQRRVDNAGLRHVTAPGDAELAPSAARTKWICSA